MKGFATLGVIVFIAGALLGGSAAAYYQTHAALNAEKTFGAQPAITAFQGGTGTSSPSGILYGDQTIRLKTLGIGSGLSFSGGILSATGGSSGFSTTSANWWASLGLAFSTTSSDYWFTTKSVSGFSTTSANFWSGAGLGFSTTSTNYWKSVTDLFSTSSATYFLAATSSVKSITTLPSLSLPYSQLTGTPTIPTALSQLTNDTGFVTSSFSTTSADWWKSQRDFFSTTSALSFSANGLAFSTTSTNYWKSVTDLFSTTSVDAWKNTRNFFSTTSADFYLTGTTSLPQLASVKNTLTGTLAANAGTLYTTATTTATCSGTVSCSTFTVTGSSPVTITGSGGGGSFPFAADTNFGQVVYSTSTPTLWLKSGIFASSTSHFFNGDFSGVLGVATTSPYGTLSVGAPAQSTPYFVIGSSSEVFKIAPSASPFLGIGTSSPYATLSVVGQAVAAYFTATTTSANTFPYASTTAVSGTSLCIGTDCRTAWPTSSSGSGAATSSFAATFPVTLTTSASAITYGYSGLTSSTPWSTGNLAGITNGNTLYGVSTSTLTPSAPLSGSFTQIGTGGSLSITQAGASANGYLSSTDWNSFNARLSTSTLAILVGQGLTFSTTSANYWASLGLAFSTTSADAWGATKAYLIAVTADAPLSGSGTSGSHLVISQANTSTNGYLSSTDWQSFNSRLSTTSLGLLDKGYFFSTTSANWWSSVGLGFSTTSTDYWASLKNYATFSYLFPGNATTSALTFTGLTLTQSTTTNATTTTLAIAGVLNCNTTTKLATNGAGAVFCDTDQTGSGGTYPFIVDAYNGIAANSTTTSIWAKGVGLFASSTIASNSTTTNATTTNLSAVLFNATNGSFTRITATNATTTAATTTSLNTSVLKVGSSAISNLIGSGLSVISGALSAAFSFTPITNFGANANATSTNLLLTAGLSASSTVRFGNAGVASQFLYSGTTGFFSLGSTSPWAQFSINPTATNGASPAFAIGSSTLTSFMINNRGFVGIGTTSPFATLSITASTTASTTGSILVTTNNVATSTSIVLTFNGGNTKRISLGTSATTVRLSGFVDGAQMKVVVCNTAGTAGTLTWVADNPLLWPSGTQPTQTTTSGKCDIWSFVGNLATSTTAISIMGAASLNY